jgi:Na+/H+ antiporter NhaD/arsenite permease-like protein
LSTVVPSILCISVPLFIARWLPVFKGEIAPKLTQDSKEGNTEFLLGMCLFLAVPILKSAFHIPPFMGMLLALCLFALYAEIKTKRAFSLTDLETGLTPQSPTMKSLQKVELPTVLFFLGILLTVAALESIGFIFNLGQSVQHSGLSTPLFMGILGITSAVIDNVPLVAGSMGMFSYPMDHETWHLLAYTAGTGGSLLIIGSAAGVVAMGIEKIGFVWYLKNIAPIAFIGYAIGYVFMLCTM